ncbi:MAG: GTP-binding protein, partial [Alphaproteobacteria bacterium]|nr:GTP-binding protein [Alphaproteobacteria bacterium]
DMVVLNKADLLDTAAMARVEAELAPSLRAGVHLVHSAHARVDAALLLGIDAAAEDDLDTRRSHHDGEDGEHDHDDFESFTVALGAVMDADALEARLIEVVRAHDVLRIKGFLDRPGRDRREVVQGVGPRFQRYFDRDWRDGEARRSELVVIGLKGLNRAMIESAVRDAVATAQAAE